MLSFLHELDRPDGLSSEVAQVHLISRLAPWIWMMTCIFLPIITTNRSPSQPNLYVHSETSAIFNIHTYIRTISLPASMSALVNSLSNIAAAGCNLLLNQTPRPISCCMITMYVSTCTHNIIVHSPLGFLHTVRPRSKSFLMCICSFICLPALAWSLGGQQSQATQLYKKIYSQDNF
jgi:hypothetical protein